MEWHRYLAMYDREILAKILNVYGIGINCVRGGGVRARVFGGEGGVCCVELKGYWDAKSF